MKIKDVTNINKEFYKITRISLVRKTNYLSDGIRRKDVIFPGLAVETFDNPRLLKTLTEKIEKWTKITQDEAICAIAGYIYFLKEDFRKAKNFFKKAIEKNPDNLDNWLDLAFTLYHLGAKEEKLAKAIIFNFDVFISIYSKTKLKLSDKFLAKISEKLLRR